MKKGQVIGSWTLVDQIKRGGNGAVWRVKSAEGYEAALKLLLTQHTKRPDRVARFRQEISFLVDHPDVPGVLPLLDHCLPERSDEQAWYVMPLAIPMVERLGSDPSPTVVLDAIGTIAETLGGLAEKHVHHRDIKPDNLFWHQGWLVGDFGLVAYPEREPLTHQGRRLGPIDYMAPEMRANADTASPEPADVFSLAKTLWVILSGSALPLPGPHRADDEAYALVNRLVHPRVAEIDVLLERSTRADPTSRPSMHQFAQEIKACLTEPPEQRQDANADELARRIADLTQSARRRHDSDLEFLRGVNDRFRRFREVAFDPVYASLSGALVGFSSTNNENFSAIARLQPANKLYAQLGWGGTFTIGAQENVSASIVLSIGLRLLDRDRSEVVGLLHFVGHRGMEPTELDIRHRIVEATPGGAIEAKAIDEIAALMADGITDALREIANFLGPTSPS